MTRVVCNTGPLIALGILGQLEILKSLFNEVIVPQAVQKEIEQGGIRLSGLENFRQANWIKIYPIEKPDELLESLLDVGEAAVISLARAEKATLVLIDERKARKVARDIYGLQPIGTARILVEAKKLKLLPAVLASFETLRREGYWIHESIVEIALREAGEF